MISTNLNVLDILLRTQKTTVWAFTEIRAGSLSAFRRCRFSVFSRLKGPSFMTSTRMWSGSDGRMRTGDQPHVEATQKIIILPTEVILSSSHAKKLACFVPEISSMDGIKVDIFRQYACKLAI